MRILSTLLFIFFGCVHSYGEHYCGPSRLSTHRTIELSPDIRDSSLRHIFGHESDLGLRPKEVILTFDDGPQPGRTDVVLDTLSSHCVKATFFIVGRMARYYPDLLRRVVSDGHTIAHHTLEHERLPLLTNREIRRTVNGGARLVEQIAYGDTHDGTTIPFFRYPYLSFTDRTDNLLAREGWLAFGANIESRDWELESSSAVYDTIISNLEREGRGIILMHDIHPRTVEMLPRLLDYLHLHNYRIVHLRPSAPRQPRSLLRLASLNFSWLTDVFNSDTDTHIDYDITHLYYDF